MLLHTLAPFLPGTRWFDPDPAFAPAAAVTVTVIHLFRMVLFMMLAGYFGRLVLTRRGAAAYAADRAKRLLLVLVVFAPIVLLSIIGVEEVARRLRGDPEPLPPLPSGIPFWLFQDPAHLWFLWVLVQIIAVVLLVRALVVARAGAERAGRWAERAGTALVLPVGGVALASLPYLGSLLLQGTARAGVHQPAGVAPELAPFVAYAGAFLVGWLLHARRDALARLVGSWPWHLGAAAVFTTVFVLLERTGPIGVTAPVAALAGWCWCYGLVGLFLRALAGGSARVRYLADSAYWVYIAHLPVTAVIQLVIAKTGWWPSVQLVAAWVVAVPLLLLSYDLLVRGTWLGAWLSGRRYEPVLARRSRVGRSR
ncbi:glucans biosynthesis protein C [Quadrisphaera granulorum]|uniref:Glucan biosynthesis protein C n=2 Tax=Quadrisphaera granulorum TaxID=317664 RepID=A0A316ATG4_9ACTN|nr:glucan biosynthesis protein C [Quadrisphaera granulorum]SZE96789.1 glucans biosynthesis protein C [Quadrisphaera granulorum]